MNKEDAEQAINKIVKEAQRFEEEPTYTRALELDKDISILRYMIGEDNFLAMHYFRRVHEEAVKFIDKHDKENNEGK